MHQEKGLRLKTKKGRTTKMYTINIERKKLLKQRREKALQNAKDRKLAKENFLTALKAVHDAFRQFSRCLFYCARNVHWFGGIVVRGCASRSLLGSYVHQK